MYAKNNKPEKKNLSPTPYNGGTPALREIFIKYQVDPQIKHRAINGNKIFLFIGNM